MAVGVARCLRCQSFFTWSRGLEWRAEEDGEWGDVPITSRGKKYTASLKFEIDSSKQMDWPSL